MYRRNVFTFGMHVDLLTLYHLAIGTLLVSAGMIFWERRANPERSRELRMLAAGFATLAIGCAAVLFRRDLPGAIGSAVSNLLVLTGYLLVLRGVASLNSREYRAGSIGLLTVMALVWVGWGPQYREFVWSHVSSVPIAIISALTAWEMWRCEAMKALHSRRIVVIVAGIHAAVYAARSSLLPWLVAAHGPSVQSIASKITIYEGVLYSVILPMALLKLIRDESHGQLLRQSQTDYLTGLGNRRWFFEHGARIVDRCKEGPVSVLAFDLDHFKAINDRHGHEMGDQVLKSFAEIAHSVLGPHAVLARIGGEEFAALLYGADAGRARTLAETVVKRFAEASPSRNDGAAIRTTVSVGLAQFHEQGPVLVDRLAAADRALYRAKSLGGNRVEQAEAEAIEA